MRTLPFLITAFVSLMLALPAQAAGPQACITRHVPKAQVVGEGRLTVLAWDVYDAQLLAPKGRFARKAPFALSLSYLREVDGEAIVKTTIDEIRRQGFSDDKKLKKWEQKLGRIFPDVKKGSVLTGVRTAEGTAVFCSGSQEIGRIDDPAFTKYFFDIWLGEKTKSQELRRRLLGRTA